MISTPPRPNGSDDPDESGGGDWQTEGSAGREAIADEEVDPASRLYWEAEADTYQAEHGAFLSGAGRPATGEQGRGTGHVSEPSGAVGGAFVWGPEGLTEAEAALLGPAPELAGQHILEVGCGAAQCSAWLAARGARAVGIDIAVAQLRHAPRGSGSLHVVAATATALPFAEARFDAAFASYGAIQFVADLPRLLAEVRRVLRPGARWVFSVTHPIRWAFPDDPGHAGLVATGSYFDRTPYVERTVTDGLAVYAEFHRTIGDYVAALRGAGFSIDAMVEPEWPEWNDSTWGGWSPERGLHLPGTLILGCRAA